ncbi:TIGR02269 family lipoprotein [Archangium violaceum]|uniref:TIGR02269 family lipoprotein n=1 Tax=Archangium violaceum TaxID=83451 RepID=UPI000AFCF1F4|nr:TIGR02269 family lipoprotein [Archangium violaceum]
MLKESLEALTTLSALKFTLPALRAATPAVLGVNLMVGPNGVMMGTRLVVSAEWVEMMRQLVRAGVLSLPAVSAAVRIQAGQVMMAQGHDDLPRGVRDALGDAPEVRAMRVTGKTGAGMAEPPRHHVMPKEHRAWFEKRGFTGKMSIERFCVTLQQATHQAIHGGGNWKLGRQWPGEWNQMLMDALLKAESRAGQMLTRNTILEIVAKRMRFYDIPMNFVRCRGK